MQVIPYGLVTRIRQQNLELWLKNCLMETDSNPLSTACHAHLFQNNAYIYIYKQKLFIA